MGRNGARLDENVEHESRIAEFRVKYDITVRELADMCGCSNEDVVDLQNGTISPFYEKPTTRNGISYKTGDVRPYVGTMAFIFETTVSKLCPRYACEIDRKNNLLVRNDGSHDISDEESTIDAINNKLVFEKLRKPMDDWLTSREKEVLKKRFYNDLGLETIGKDYGITMEAIRQTEEKAIRRIRGRLGNTLLKKLSKDLRSCL